MKKYFITGTDTHVGKTLTAAILVVALQGIYWKPIQSGVADDISDLEQVKKLTGLPEEHLLPSVYTLQASLSPDQAAELESITIQLSQCKMPQTVKPLIIEGAGGVLVPLNDTVLQTDLMKQFNIPVIIVSRGTLGTINHTLLTIDVLRQRGLTIHGVIFSGELNLKSQRAIEKWGKINTLFHIPPLKKVTHLHVKKWLHKNQQTILRAVG